MHTFLAVATTTLLAATSLEPGSRIDAVTVYHSSARVTRVARLELPAGDVQVLLKDLTEQLMDDSLSLEGEGSARVKVFGAAVERVPLEDAADPAARTLEERILTLERQDRALEGQLQSAAPRRAFVDSLKAVFSQERTQNLTVRPADPKEWTSMADFVGREYALVQEQVSRTTASREDLARQLRALREELQLLRAKTTRTTKTVAVDLRVERAGTFELAVSYLVPSASWQPVWDARLDAEKATVELGLSGMVTQRTGEDWKDVKLAVSTAQPQRPLYVPELHARYVDRVQPRSIRSKRPQRHDAYAEEEVIVSAPAAPPAEAYAGAAVAADEVYEAEQPAAQLTQRLLSAQFTAARRESIEGAGRPRKAFLAAFPLKGELERRAAPLLDAQTFLTAKVRNESGAPLLPGPVSVYLGDEFLGRTQMPFSPLGDELKLAFGADDRIKVERKLVERKHETAGLFAKEDVYRFRARTTVKNLYPKEATVTLLDQVPVSRDETIQVTVLDGSTPTTSAPDPGEPGVRTHTLTLGPKAEKVVDLVYEVRFPRGQTVTGLE